MKEVSVIGAGTMGNGIAHVFAMAGYQVTLCDISAEALEKALNKIAKNLDRMLAKEKITEADKVDALARIKTDTSMENAVANADLVVEAATENIDLKLSIFKQLDAFTTDDCILLRIHHLSVLQKLQPFVLDQNLL